MKKKIKIFWALTVILAVVALSLAGSCASGKYNHMHSVDSIFIYGGKCDKHLELEK